MGTEDRKALYAAGHLHITQLEGHFIGFFSLKTVINRDIMPNINTYTATGSFACWWPNMSLSRQSFKYDPQEITICKAAIPYIFVKVYFVTSCHSLRS